MNAAVQISTGRRASDKPMARNTSDRTSDRRAPARMTARNTSYREKAAVLDQAHLNQLIEGATAILHAVTPAIVVPEPKLPRVPRETQAAKPAPAVVATPAVAPVEQTEDAPAKPVGYTGPMLALRQRSKLGLYKKAENGQPSCGDEIAQALGTLRPEFVIKACLLAMALDANPYAHLNVGQQSMNLRNKLRGLLKAGEFGMGVVHEAVEEAKAAQDAVTH